MRRYFKDLLPLFLALATSATVVAGDPFLEFNVPKNQQTSQHPRTLDDSPEPTVVLHDGDVLTEKASLEYWGFDNKPKQQQPRDDVLSTPVPSAQDGADEDDSSATDIPTDANTQSTSSVKATDEAARPSAPPAYMINLYNSITDSNGVMKVPNPYGAKMIIALEDEDVDSQFSVRFDVSDISPTARILAAELHLFVERAVVVTNNYYGNTFAYWDPLYGDSTIMMPQATSSSSNVTRKNATGGYFSSKGYGKAQLQQDKQMWNAGKHWHSHMAAKLMLYENTNEVPFRRLIGSRRLPPTSNPRWVVFNVEPVVEHWQATKRQHQQQTNDKTVTPVELNSNNKDGFAQSTAAKHKKSDDTVRLEVLLTSGVGAANKLRADTFGLTFKSRRRANSYKPVLVLYLDDGSSSSASSSSTGQSQYSNNSGSSSNTNSDDKRYALFTSTMRPATVTAAADRNSTTAGNTASSNYRIADPGAQSAYAQRKLREAGHVDAAQRYIPSLEPSRMSAGGGRDDIDDDEDDAFIVDTADAAADERNPESFVSSSSRRVRRSVVDPSTNGMTQYYDDIGFFITNDPYANANDENNNDEKFRSSSLSPSSSSYDTTHARRAHQRSRRMQYNSNNNAVAGYSADFTADSGEQDEYGTRPALQQQQQRRRSSRRRRYKSRHQKSCRKQKLHISFQAIGWSTWIISPKGYDAYDCKGLCKFPIPMESKPSNHATVVSLAATLPFSKLKGPCCVPETLLPISLLYYNDKGNVVLRQHDDMVVGSCSCR